MANATPAFPRIHLSPAEREYYDHSADTFLRQAVTEYSNYPGYLDQSAWTHVRRAQDMSVYKSAYGVRDPQVTLMMGVGCIPGTVRDVMSGIYSDTTEDLRTVRTLLKHPLVDAGVFNVSERASEEEPYRFAGIKWFSAKAAWGMAQTRDVLAYERMGRTQDALGHELAYHVLYSIDRSEWPADSIKGVKRQHQITCFLYRQLDDKRVECFLWGTIYRLGSVSRRLAEYVVAGVLLAVVNAPTSARACKLSTLMSSARRSAWTGSVGTLCCYTCRGQSFLSSNRPCAGCSQFVCRTCSASEKVFSLDLRTRRVQKRRFCRYCINSTAVSEEQTFEKSAAGKTRRKKKPKSKSIDATLSAAPWGWHSRSVRRTAKSEVASDFSSARHWTSDSSDTTTQRSNSNRGAMFSDFSDSDMDSSDEESEQRPRGLTAADLVSLSREPVKSKRSGNHKTVSFSCRGRPGQWHRAPSGLMPMHAEFLNIPDEVVMLEAHPELNTDVDAYHQSPDGVDDPNYLHAASGLSQFSLGMDINSTSQYEGASDSDLDEVFNPNRTLVMPSSLRKNTRGPGIHALREDKPDEKVAFLSDLYSLSASQVQHGPRRQQPRRR